MWFETVLHSDYADPPTTWRLVEIEGPDAETALTQNLDKVIKAAEDILGPCDKIYFTQEDLIKLVCVLHGDKHWLAAKDVASDL